MARRYTKDHEWAELKDGLVWVGISDHAQHALGDVVSIELPEAGRQIKQKESVAIVDSMKASSDVYAPVSGEVAEVNGGLGSDPQWVNESPYEKGWFFKVKPADVKELDGLMTEEQYSAYLNEQAH